MLNRKKVIYVPALRMKRGELEGLFWLREDVSDCIIPLLIVPPAKERSSSSQESLFVAEKSIPDVGGILSKYWVNRKVFVDPRVLFKEYGADAAVNWLSELFNRAWRLGVHAIPCSSLTTLEEVGAGAFKTAILDGDGVKFCLLIPSADMADLSIGTRVRDMLQSLGLKPSECAVVTDFTDADLSEPSFVAPIVQNALEQLQNIGQWQMVIFLGTHYPEKNPAEPGQTFSCARNEWNAWTQAVRFDPSTAEQMVFGDFAADSAKIDFKTGRAQPIRHVRYTTATEWLVVRGEAEGSDYEVMKDVFERIVTSERFAGAGFSNADAYIYDVARNNASSAGNATTWRQVNTAHHITQVVADIAAVRKIPISKIPSPPAGVQQDLLEI